MQQPRWLGLFLAATGLASAGCVTPTYITGSAFVSRPSSESVLYTAVGRTDGIWLRMRSLDDGHLVASAWVFFWHRFAQVSCRPSVPGRLWCLENSSDVTFSHGLRVRDDESLHVIAEQGEIMARAPELGHVWPIEKWRVNPETHRFEFSSRDGYTWGIDPTTLVPSRLEVPGVADPKPDKSSSCPSQLGGDCYTLRGGLRKRLERNGVALHPEHTYLDPQLVKAVDGWPYVLITEKVLDHDPTLWCLSPDGTVRWKVTDFPDQYVVSAKLYRDTLVLVSYKALVALRPQDGAILWTSPP